MDPRTLGVEEEMFLVDPGTGRLVSAAPRALHLLGDVEEAVEGELMRPQLETNTPPCADLDDLAGALRAARDRAAEAAESVGARLVAVPTPVLEQPGEPAFTGSDRYARIRDEYGALARRAQVCAMHVHVAVDGEEEAVGVVDGIRPWLPVLLALSANSPFWHGADTGHASWRSQVWGGWPSAGQAQAFGDAATYRETADRLVAWGAALDTGMLYADIRPAESYPTVEVRVADVCTDLDDAVLVAGLARALVTTVAEEWRGGQAPDLWRTDLLRAATWRAARFGVAGPLVHPLQRELRDTREVIGALVERTRDALDAAGDLDRVTDGVERLLARGGGATRQRAVHEATGDLTRVVADLAERTAS